jgi:hypothetical protein
LRGSRLERLRVAARPPREREQLGDLGPHARVGRHHFRQVGLGREPLPQRETSAPTIVRSVASSRAWIPAEIVR